MVAWTAAPRVGAAAGCRRKEAATNLRSQAAKGRRRFRGAAAAEARTGTGTWNQGQDTRGGDVWSRGHQVQMEHREGRQSRSGGRGGGGQHTSFDNGWHADPMQRRKMIQQPPMRGAGKAAEESARRRVERAMRSQQEQRRPEGKARKGSSAPFGLMMKGRSQLTRTPKIGTVLQFMAPVKTLYDPSHKHPALRDNSERSSTSQANCQGHQLLPRTHHG